MNHVRTRVKLAVVAKVYVASFWLEAGSTRNMPRVLEVRSVDIVNLLLLYSGVE